MNKKEVAEIKRQFKMDNEDMVINNIGIYYINKENEIVCSQIKRFAEQKDMTGGMPGSDKYWAQLEEERFIEIFKKTLGGQLGKGLVEYNFPNELLLSKEETCYSKLSDILNGNLEIKSEVDEYISFLADKLNRNEEYAICIASCAYSLPVKDINGFKTKDDDLCIDVEEYDFVLVSICPIIHTNIGLFYNKNKKQIEHKENDEKTVALPVTGFLFPAFNNRSTDVNSVLVYNKKSKEPDLALIQSALGCNFIMDAEEERNKFNIIITKVITGGDDANIAIDYNTTQSIHSIISEKISESVLDTELPTISRDELKSILKRSGVSDEKLEKYDEIYDEVMDSKNIQLKAVNVINASKLDIKSPDVVINVKSDKSDKVTAKEINGKRCLVVELDDDVEINGLNVKVK